MRRSVRIRPGLFCCASIQRLSGLSVFLVDPEQRQTHLYSMPKQKIIIAPALVETWTLSPAATFGSAVRAI